MNDIYAAAIGGGITGTLGVVVCYIRLKKLLKEEIVDPEIMRLESIVKEMRKDFESELNHVIEDNNNNDNKLSAKLDKKFDELNSKMDKNSQAVSTMQGMLTAIFNGLRNNVSGYEQ